MGNVSMGKVLKTLPISVCQYMAKYSTYGVGARGKGQWDRYSSQLGPKAQVGSKFF